MMKHRFLSVLMIVIIGGHNGLWGQETVINLTDQVLVKDCVPLGINLGGDAYYSGAALVKKRTTANFEGTSYRECHFGPLQDETGATTWFQVREPWKKILIGGRYTILSGPAKGTTGIIRDITTKKVEHQKRLKDFTYFVFDKRVKPGPPNGGLLVEAYRLEEGQFRPLDGYWTSKNNGISIGDVPPGSFGHAAARLNGSQSRAHLRFSTHYQRYGQTNGTWHVDFWAKARAGAPRLKVTCDRDEWGENKSLEPTPTWKKYQLSLVADKVPEPKNPKDNPHLLFRFEVTGGEMLLDDVEIWMEGDTNPTVFRDDCVNALKKYGPGVIRFLQMGGNTLANTLNPPLRAHAFTSRRYDKTGPFARHGKTPYSLHEMYELCEYVGAEPWYSLPGTLSQRELKYFMEYLGAPADEGYGKRRAELGHPKPWTEVFKHIHVEFGNEAWNNAGPYQCGGYKGPDYWRDLIETGKHSPFYRKNILFHAAGQATNSLLNRSIVKYAPNADRLAVAPYIIHGLSKKELERLNTDEKLFRWVFGWPIWRATNKDGAMRQNYEVTRKAGLELSVYEINHHITQGDAPAEPRNRIVTSIAGGLNVANCMLQMLRDFGCRDQCLFSLVQHSYNAHNVGRVRLWGTVLNMRKGRERYRPTFLACALANRVIQGNLVATRLEGANPTFSATGVFKRRAGPEPLNNIPCLQTYAFADGNRRGLIVINLDVKASHQVAVKFPGTAAQGAAENWALAADRITANNEFEAGQPQLALQRRTLPDFQSGQTLTIRPYSMQGLTWVVK